MKLYIKTLLLAAFFAFAVLGLQAQEKYHYLVLEADNLSGSIMIFTDGKDSKKVVPNTDEYVKLGFVNMLIKEVQKIEDEGWVLFDSKIFAIGRDNVRFQHYYQFRKKRE